MAIQDREDVIQIVGHARGEMANGFHLLRLAQLGLELLLIRDILHDGEEVRTGGSNLYGPASILSGRGSFLLMYSIPPKSLNPSL